MVFHPSACKEVVGGTKDSGHWPQAVEQSGTEQNSGRELIAAKTAEEKQGAEGPRAG